MTDPLFWLVLSFLFVTVCLTIVLVVTIPALRELGRAARSAEKLFDTLRREFPPTLEAIRLTGLEITDLTDDLSEGVQSAGQVVKQVDQTLSGARQQAHKVQLGTRSLVAGLKTAWKTFTRPQSPSRRAAEQLPPAKKQKSPDQSTHVPNPSAKNSPNNSAVSPVPEQISGSRFIATANEVIEQVQPPPSSQSPVNAAPDIAKESSADL